MPRKSIALFLATTGLISTLAGCGPGKEADERGGDAMTAPPAGHSAQPSQDPAQPSRETEDKGSKHENGDQHQNGDKKDEGGEGGEGGEG